MELLRHRARLAVGVLLDRVQVERLVGDEDQVGLKEEALLALAVGRLKVQQPEGLERFDQFQLQVVVAAVGHLVQAAQRLRAALLEQQWLKDVEVFVD